MYGLKQPLCFVDIETNGMSAQEGKIIEIAAIRVEPDGRESIYTSLLDPGAALPHFITSLTGISDADLDSAPTFRNIADELYSFLDGAIFVAHNVSFDYSFVKEEFLRTNYDYNPQRFCTVRLSRRLFPEHRRHNLNEIIRRHNIQVNDRHRALGDAKAMQDFFTIASKSIDKLTFEKQFHKLLT